MQLKILIVVWVRFSTLFIKIFVFLYVSIIIFIYILDDTLLSSGPSYSAQNLYVVPPTRPNTMPASLTDDKSNLVPRGRSRNPLLDVSLSQLDRPSTPQGTGI